MSIKYYRVLKTNFMWEEGAILEIKDGQARPIGGTSVWDTTDVNESEYISQRIIEAATEWFGQVYPVNGLTRTYYKAKQEARELLKKEYMD